MNIQIFDNGGKTADRYCLIVDKTRVYTMAVNPLHDPEVRYLCDAIDLDRREAGRSTKLSELPKALIEAIHVNGSTWFQKEAA